MVFLEKDAREFGFDWPHQQMILDQIIDECREVKEAIEEGSQSHIQEEIGDLIHAAISLCIFSGYDVEETIEKINQKFEERMQAIKQIAAQRGLDTLQEQSTDFMMDLWREAKKEISKNK